MRVKEIENESERERKRERVTVKTKAMYLAVIGLGYRFFVLDRLPLAQSLSRMLSRKRYTISYLAAR